MPNFSARGVGAGAAGFVSVDPTLVNQAILLPLGTVVETRHGRCYRWAKAGAVDLVAGNVIQSAAIITAHLANTPPVVPISATSFLYTPGAAAAPANFYAEGYLQVDTAPGNGYTYSVAGHGPITSGTAFILNLDPADALQQPLTATSRVGLIASPWQQVIQAPAAATGTLAGVATYIISANQNGWLQTWGPASVLMSDGTAVGLSVGVPAATAGAAVAYAAATTTLLGQMMQTAVIGKNNFVFLRIG